MKRWPARLAAFVLVLLLTACTSPQTACSELGSSSGVLVTVDRDLVESLTTLQLRVCHHLDAATPSCQTAKVRLDPGTDSVDQGCDGSGPDAACSATVVPNLSKVGFVEMADLPEGRISVAATATISGHRQTFPAIDVTAKATYPNGPDCGAEGRQAAVIVRPDGLH